ncbi:hypothetical protein L1887_52923 [Cichorium endivia]|nr:hypothetical protein L1887_52923 [Cichorium endivia]
MRMSAGDDCTYLARLSPESACNANESERCKCVCWYDGLESGERERTKNAGRNADHEPAAESMRCDAQVGCERRWRGGRDKHVSGSSRKKWQKSKKSSQQSSRRVCSLCAEQRVGSEMRAVMSLALLRWRPTAIDDFSSRVLAVDEAADSARLGNPLSFARIIRTTLSATFLALGLFRAALTTFEAPDYKSRAKIVFARPTRSSRNRACAPAMNFVDFFAARKVAEAGSFADRELVKSHAAKRLPTIEPGAMMLTRMATGLRGASQAAIAPPRRSLATSSALLAAAASDKKRIAVLGGGIAGLTSAYRLAQQLPQDRYDVVLLEQQSRLGGWIQSERISLPSDASTSPSPTALVEMGPAQHPSCRLLWAGDASARPIAWTARASSAGAQDGAFSTESIPLLPGQARQAAQQHPLASFRPVQAPLPSRHRAQHHPRAACALALPPTALRIPGREEAAAAARTARRRERDTRKLSVRAVMPFLWEAERVHGSVLRSMLPAKRNKRHRPLPEPEAAAKAAKEDRLKHVEQQLGKELVDSFKGISVYSFPEGVQEIVAALEQRLATLPNFQLRKGDSVRGINIDESGKLRITTASGESIEADRVISSVPSSKLADILPSAELPHLKHNPAANVAVVNVVISPSAAAEAGRALVPVQGFGYLIPRTTPGNDDGVLGVVFDSDAVPDQDAAEPSRRPVKLTVMMGGAHWAGLEQLPDADEVKARAIVAAELHGDDQTVTGLASFAIPPPAAPAAASAVRRVAQRGTAGLPSQGLLSAIRDALAAAGKRVVDAEEEVGEDGVVVEWFPSVDMVLIVAEEFSIVTAHEFFDALPTHIFEKHVDGKFREVLVGIKPKSSITVLRAGTGDGGAQGGAWLCAFADAYAVGADAGAEQSALCSAPTGTARRSVPRVVGRCPSRGRTGCWSTRLAPSQSRCYRGAESTVRRSGQQRLAANSAGGVGLIIDYGGDQAYGASFRAFKQHALVDVFQSPRCSGSDGQRRLFASQVGAAHDECTLRRADRPS